jgi:hypothetical protein
MSCFQASRLKAPGFNPCAYQVISSFQNFAFKWVNLHRYGAARALPRKVVYLPSCVTRMMGRGGAFAVFFTRDTNNAFQLFPNL